MTTAEEIARAVWTHPTRTAATGTPRAPTNQAEEIAQAIWEKLHADARGGECRSNGLFDMDNGGDYGCGS